MNQKTRNILCSVLALTALLSCTEIDPITKPAPDRGSLDFTRFHSLGNSFTAGVQNAGLVTAFQNTSIPAMIAQAAGAGTLQMPLVAEPGNPATLYVASYAGPVIQRLPGTGLPTNTSFPGIYHNLGIPGARLTDVLNTGPGAGGAYALVLRDAATFGPTAIAQLENANPTFSTVWIGNNDILGSATMGTDALMTPLASFEVDYRALMDRVAAASPAAVAVNIPDIPAIPFFTTIPPVVVNPATREPVLDPMGNPIPLIGFNQGMPGALPPGTLVTLAAAESLAVGVGVPTLVGGTGRPLANFQVLDPTELANIRARTAAFNAVVDSVCSNRGVPVVDAFTLLNTIAADGIEIRGETFTTDFLTGGLFSVDGIHPSTLGYWVVAREMIRVINGAFGANMDDPYLPVGPLRDPGLGQTSNLVPVMTLSIDELRGVWDAVGVPKEQQLP